MTPRLELPTIQNWSCHICSGCCRQHLIEITDEERQRIERQNWQADGGIPESQPTVVSMGLPWQKRYRLAHQPDGACAFLDEQGLCRIHAKFGEAAKPLACRVYPYALHPAGKSVVVSLRFSCPSVVANRGAAVADNRGELKKISRLVVPERASSPPPEITSRQQLSWDDFHRFVAALDRSFAAGGVTVLTKLRRALYWTDLVANATFEKIQGQRIADFLELICSAADAEIVDGGSAELPTRAGRLQFRMLCAQYARKDTVLSAGSGMRGRLRLLRGALRFARGRGDAFPLQDGFAAVPFDRLESPFGFPAEADELFTRYFRVKIQGLHFCGPAYYGAGFVAGFRSLALMFPVTLWLARWLAGSDGREQLSLDDVSRALAIADHHHGYSPALGHWGARRRVTLMANAGDIERLCCWYTR